MEYEFIPWIEKYRPSNFNSIVLEPYNKRLLNNILATSYFPNLLFYGPPGTGKTTTIINLIKHYYQNNTATISVSFHDLVIHLNASDDRGVEVIRTQIQQFVSTKSVFNGGMKFVILDEADYMTKQAQQALRHLIQTFSNEVRFCLICNYISKIEEGLQTDFLKIRFNQLPEENIHHLLMDISNKENIDVSMNVIQKIQQTYNSDIRSMINYLQANQYIINDNICIIDNSVWEKLYKLMNMKQDISEKKKLERVTEIYKSIRNISIIYNINIFNLAKNFITYIIDTYPCIITHDFLNSIEDIIHNKQEDEVYIRYFVYTMLQHITYL